MCKLTFITKTKPNMKQKLYSVALALLPLSALAQPTVTTVEDYQLNTSVRYVNCNATGKSAGAAGANQTWNFSSLTRIDTVVDAVITPNWTPFVSQHPQANVVRRTKDGDFLYYNKTSTENYLIAEHDVPANRHLTHPNTLLAAKRPLTFNNTFTDTFSTLESTSSAHGMGIMNMTVDAYGTLQTPIKTYNNVIRVKVTLVSRDTITSAPAPFPSPSVINTVATLYSWYNNDQKSALLRWDSTAVYVNTATTPTNTGKSMAYYLAEFPYSVGDVDMEATSYNAAIVGRKLVLNGSFTTGLNYNASIYNLNGQKMQEYDFVSSDKTQQFDINTDLPAGMYIIILRDQRNATPYILKATKD
ncbi:MAG: T9SS type A sorting domain-containing protein [Sphingobacteriales bacterium]|nr:MAG: T9SS type A sorting domain-containing protein [Sphingobacteriales bacterium]